MNENENLNSIPSDNVPETQPLNVDNTADDSIAETEVLQATENDDNNTGDLSAETADGEKESIIESVFGDDDTETEYSEAPNYVTETGIIEQAQPKKKKTAVYVSIIIAACILVLSVVGFGAFKLLNNKSVVGSWVWEEDLANATETTDEAGNTVIPNVPYLTFNKDGSASYKIGTLEYYGPYSTVTENGTSTLTATIPYALSGEYTYVLDGNAFSKKTLSINMSGEDFVFNADDLPSYTVDVKDGFVAEDAIIGTWRSESEGQEVLYSFNEDGTMVFRIVAEEEKIGMRIDGTYTVADGIVTFYYLVDIETSLELECAVTDTGLTIGGDEFTKVTD